MKNKFPLKRVVAVISFLLLISLTACAGRQNSDLASNVQTVSLQRGNLTAVVGATGTVRSNQSTMVSWQTSGKVDNVLVKLGQKVTPDQVLASLDPTSLAQNIIQAKADLINAQSALEELKKPQPLEIAQAETALANTQSALDDLLNPSALVIAQAETSLKDAQTALDNLLNPDPLAITQAEQVIIDAQKAFEDAQNKVDRLTYPRGSKADIEAARASYVLAQSEVDRLQKVYEKTPGLPDKDPVKARALSDLESAKVKRDRALANLNWYEAVWSEEDIVDRNSALALAQARLTDAQKVLDQLKNPSTEDIELAKARVTDAEKRITTLYTPTLSDIELAKQQVAEAQDVLDQARNGPTSDDLAVAETRITVAQATINQTQLRAPFGGTITEIHVMPGDMVSPGTIGFRIDDLSSLYIELQVSEIDIYLVQLGMPVNLAFDAIPDKVYVGDVTDIGLVGSLYSGVVNFKVTVQVINPDSAVRTGMTVVASVIISQVEDVLQVPNRAIQTKDGKKVVYVWRQETKDYNEVEVQIGLSSDTMTEIITQELNVGDAILVTIPTNLPERMFGGR